MWLRSLSGGPTCAHAGRGPILQLTTTTRDLFCCIPDTVRILLLLALLNDSLG